MCKQILLPTAVKNEMMKTFKIERNTLSRALKFQTNSSPAKKLRAAAFQRGGLIYNDMGYEKGFIPNCDTTFDHSNGTMTQILPNGIRMVVYKESNTARVYDGEQQIAKFNDMTLNDWSRILFGLQMIYNNLSL